VNCIPLSLFKERMINTNNQVKIKLTVSTFDLIMKYGPSDEMTAAAIETKDLMRYQTQLFMGGYRGENEELIGSYILDATTTYPEEALNNGYHHGLVDCLFRCMTTKTWKRFGGVRKLLEQVDHPTYKRNYNLALERTVKNTLAAFEDVGLYKDIAILCLSYIVNSTSTIYELMSE
jgi:hypothetical protein